MKKVITIAGSDPSGGAGLQADLKTFAALGVYGLSVVTAVTAQNTVAVTGVHPVPPEFVAVQIDTVLDDVVVEAAKTGMLASVKNIEVVVERLRRRAVPNIVADPVLTASSGGLLTTEPIDRMVRAWREILLPAADVITPNIPEAELLAGRQIRGVEEMKAAAVDLHKLGAANVVIKGGHLAGLREAVEAGEAVEAVEAVDILFDGREFFVYRGAILEVSSTHGTGCTFAAALAAGLAKGLTIREAVGEAKNFVRGALEHGLAIGRGRGPVNQFAEIYRKITK